MALRSRRWARPGSALGSVAVLAGSLALGCVGSIGDGEPGESAQGGSPPGTTPSGQDPGRVTIHRLNRVEYDNTVRDLLGTEQRLASDFPADDHAYGFDNMADTLVLSPLLFELYERAAETLAEEVFRVGVPSSLERLEAEMLMGTVGQATENAWLLWSNGDVSTTKVLPADGTYRVRTRLWQSAAGPDPARATLTFGTQTFGPFDVVGDANAPTVIEQDVVATGASAVVTVSFVNDYYDPAASLDRNLFVDWIEVEGPLDAVVDNPLRGRIVTCDPIAEGEPCVRSIVRDLGLRAHRRPLEESEIDTLIGLYDLALAEGDSADEGLKLVLRAVLTSAHFLYRVEIDPDPSLEQAHPLGDYELASRLSYFLWSSMPDDELFGLAAQGKLHDPEVVRAQVARMLDDPRSIALVENFAGQWLYLRALAAATPNAAAFPSFDEPLRAAMLAESQLAFAELLRDGGPGLDVLVRAETTFLNERLADHYGLDGVVGDALVPVVLDTDRRGGLLRQGAWLTVTSNPDRTSPVKRGKWILENLLCDAPPPPPPGVEGFAPADLEAKSQKELLEAHRARPECAACHAVMDPLGLALENFDGIGAWREIDHGTAVDPAGEFEGAAFSTQSEFVDLLVSDARFSKCVVQKMLTYALGRGLAESDAPYVEELDAELRISGLSLRQLAIDIAMSEVFRYRRGQKEAP